MSIAKTVRMPFGKHKGLTIDAVAQADPLYLDWLAGQRGSKPDSQDILDRAIAVACDEYEAEIVQAMTERENNRPQR